MAIKPMGKAIIILVVVASIGAGVIYSGALNKLPAPQPTATSAPVAPLPAPQKEPVVEQAVVVNQQPQPQPVVEVEHDAAFEAVMKAAQAKKGSK